MFIVRGSNPLRCRSEERNVLSAKDPVDLRSFERRPVFCDDDDQVYKHNTPNGVSFISTDLRNRTLEAKARWWRVGIARLLLRRSG